MFSAPIITSITPRYGPVKQSVDAVIEGQNFQCPDPACSRLSVRFGTEEYGTIVSAKLISSTKIGVKTPEFTKPDVLPVDISFNGYDFTSEGL